ncbi:MAG: DUF2147 domain-containing protein [Oceanicaulis sp.]
MLDLVLSLSLAAAQAGAPMDQVTSLWATGDNGGRVEVEPCDRDETLLCGALVDAQVLRSEPEARDANNPDPALRNRPLRGVRVLDGFERGDDGAWTPGLLYDPEEGREISRGHVKLVAEDRLEVRGCVAFICRTQIWERVDEGA